MKKKPKNSFKQMLNHYTYNGDMLSVGLFIEIVVMMILFVVLPQTDKGMVIRLALIFGIVVTFSEMVKYTYSRTYKSDTIIIRKLGKNYMNQRANVKYLPEAKCAIEALDEDLLEGVRKIVIKKGQDLYLTTHYHVIKLFEDNLGDEIMIKYNPDDFYYKSLKGDKKALIKKCGQCTKCKNRQTCKLHKEQAVKMYNLKIVRRIKTEAAD